MDTNLSFQEAIAASKTLTKRPSNDDLLKLYALYKQATEGDVKGKKPGGFDFKGQAKYAAWEKLVGTSQPEAETSYINLIQQLLKTHK
ncbi:MAG: acyl-CoA-binding protein [Flammeovirgaceae bacterium]